MKRLIILKLLVFIMFTGCAGLKVYTPIVPQPSLQCRLNGANLYSILPASLCFVQSGAPEKALKILNVDPAKLSPLEDYVYFFSAFSLYHMGKKKEALDLVEASLSLFPDSPLLPLMKAFSAVILIELGERERGERILASLEGKKLPGYLKEYVLYHLIIAGSDRRPSDETERLLMRFAGMPALSSYIMSLYSLGVASEKHMKTWINGAYRKRYFASLQRACPHLKKFIKKWSDAQDYLTKCGEGLFYMGDYSQAERFFKDVLRMHKNDPHALFYLARIYYRTGRKSLTIPLFKKIVREAHSDAWACRSAYKIAELLDGDDKIPFLDIIIKKGESCPYYENALFFKALLLYKNGYASPATSLFEKLKQLKTGTFSHAAVYWLSKINQDGGMITDSFVEGSPPDVYSLFALAILKGKDVLVSPPQRDEGGKHDEVILLRDLDRSVRRLKILRDTSLNGFLHYEMEWNLYTSPQEDREAFFKKMVEYGLPWLSIKWFSRIWSYPSSLSEVIQKRELYSLLYPKAFEDEVNLFCKMDYNLDSNLIYAMIHQESHFNPDATSRAGAKGLMQLMPFTARRMSAILELSPEGFDAPRRNIYLGCSYFKLLMDAFGGNVPLALAAYNAGPQRVRKWLAKLRPEEVELFIEFIPFPETRNYVKKVLTKWFLYTVLYGGRIERRAVVLPPRFSWRGM